MRERKVGRRLSFEFFEASTCVLDPLIRIGGILLPMKIFLKRLALPLLV
jgi:hypothetical protein